MGGSLIESLWCWRARAIRITSARLLALCMILAFDVCEW